MTKINHNSLFFIGPRFQHHAIHSGYEIFTKKIGSRIKSPVKVKSLAGRLGQYKYIGDLGSRIDELVTSITPRPLYWSGIFLIELYASLHMLRNKNSIYHVLYGDTDVWITGYTKKFTSNKLIATFHSPPAILEWLKIDNIVNNLDAVFLVSFYQKEYFKNIYPDEKI